MLFSVQNSVCDEACDRVQMLGKMHDIIRNKSTTPIPLNYESKVVHEVMAVHGIGHAAGLSQVTNVCGNDADDGFDEIFRQDEDYHCMGSDEVAAETPFEVLNPLWKEVGSMCDTFSPGTVSNVKNYLQALVVNHKAKRKLELGDIEPNGSVVSAMVKNPHAASQHKKQKYFGGT